MTCGGVVVIHTALALDAAADADTAALAAWWAALEGDEAQRASGLRARAVLGHAVLRQAEGALVQETRGEAAEQHRALALAREAEWERAAAAQAAELQAERARALQLERQLAGAAQRLGEELEAAARREVEAARAQQARLDEALARARAQADEERARMRAAHDAAVRAVEEERGRLNAHYTAMAARAADAAEGHRALSSVLSQLDARDADLRAHVAQLATSAQAGELQRLRDALAAAQADNDRLRGCNHVKGALGEARVMGALQRAFPDWAFVDTSARGAESDFHMTGAAGEVLAVEVKNKGVVTAGDVEKSLRDVRELQERLGARLVGYLFVSVRSRNIPRKGGLALEAAHGVPVLWYGMDEAPDADVAARDDADMARAAGLLLDVGRACLGRGGGGEGGAEGGAECRARMAAMVRQVGGMLQRLDRARTSATGMRNALSLARRHADEVAVQVDAAFQDAEAFVRTFSCGESERGSEAVAVAGVSAGAGASASTGASASASTGASATSSASDDGGDSDAAPPPPPQQQQEFVCEGCGRPFGTARGLSRHWYACRSKMCGAGAGQGSSEPGV